jgi:hypothetical protein
MLLIRLCQKALQELTLIRQQRRCSSKAVMQTMPEVMLYLAIPSVPMAIEQLDLQEQGIGKLPKPAVSGRWLLAERAGAANTLIAGHVQV